MYFQAVGQGAVSKLQVTGSSWDEEVARILVTHSGTGGLAARIAGVLDGKGTVSAFYDSDLPPYLPAPGIVAGINGVYLFYITPVKFFQIPVIVPHVHYETQVLGATQYSFDAELNALAGSYVRPPS